MNIFDIEKEFGNKFAEQFDLNPHNQANQVVLYNDLTYFMRQAIKTAFEATRVENMSCNHNLSYSVERDCHERQIKGYNQALSEVTTRQNEFLKE